MIKFGAIDTASRAGRGVVDVQRVRKKRKINIPTEKETVRFEFEDFETLLVYDPRLFVESPIAHCHGYTWKLRVYPKLQIGEGGLDRTVVFLRLADVPKTADPDSIPDGEENRSFAFEDFENLLEGDDDPRNFVYSPVAHCHGYTWKLRVYPKLQIGEGGLDRTVVFLRLADVPKTADPLLTLSVTFRTTSGRELDKCEVEMTVAHSVKATIVRSEALDRDLGHLTENGTLVVDVDIQILNVKEKPLWYPEVGSKDADQLKLMESDDSVDAYFVVKTYKFPVYRCILGVKAPMLRELVENVEKGGDVEIEDVSPAAFEALLRFVYGRERPDSNFVRENGRELVEAADRFGCKKLKLWVESDIVRHCITTENVASWIVLADSHSCGYLKEAAIEVFDSDLQAVMKSRGWEELSDSNELLVELVGRLADRYGKRRRTGWWAFVRETTESGEVHFNIRDYNRMSVWGLRKLIEQRGGDEVALDGTREMLVQWLLSSENGSSV
eukprot:CAMPEP_0194068956 /NCGR_PEP_ID=MMETSP0009_2-20130614/87377_1 /TAXON_ID=210454 /ORGANISM="Grammatophora oceanica, Strain CCMP 410" /LENGTH=498 /DNA_ID=CAMNT_0038722101 /DNA_START=37 /DNA_END=1534 /DNA_ORIENTATION=-